VLFVRSPFNVNTSEPLVIIVPDGVSDKFKIGPAAAVAE
jgi:hypothetical protein